MRPAGRMPAMFQPTLPLEHRTPHPAALRRWRRRGAVCDRAPAGCDALLVLGTALPHRRAPHDRAPEAVHGVRAGRRFSGAGGRAASVECPDGESCSALRRARSITRASSASCCTPTITVTATRPRMSAGRCWRWASPGWGSIASSAAATTATTHPRGSWGGSACRARGAPRGERVHQGRVDR